MPSVRRNRATPLLDLRGLCQGDLYLAIPNNRREIVITDKTIKQAHFLDVATSDSLKLHGIINEKLPKPKDVKNLINIWQLKTSCVIPLAPLYQNIYTKALKCLISALIYVFWCRKQYFMLYSPNVFAGEWIRSLCSERPTLFREPAKLLWSKECG